MQVSAEREARFWAKVDTRGVCWEWTAARFTRRGGYGAFGWMEGRRAVTVRAHRFAFELLVGEIPAGKLLDHLCRNPVCVNPDHLEVVSPRTNTQRGYGPTAKGRERFEERRIEARWP